MEYKDYYKILGVERTADQESIKKAFRRMAAKYHPDRNQDKGAEERFKEINEANEVLGDATKRARYDQLGSDWRAGDNFKPPPTGAVVTRHNLMPPFLKALPAVASMVKQPPLASVTFLRVCLVGDSAVPPPPAATSPAQGAAILHVEVEDIYRGLKTIRLPSGGNVQIRIPPDIADDKRMRIPGKGPHGSDIYLKVKLKEHPLYRLENSDVYLDLPITPWEAALGETITVPTLAGKISLKIPPGSQSGKKMRLKGRGLPGTEPGDLYIVLTR